MNKPLKSIPDFTNEDEERAFWGADENDSTEYLNWSLASQAKFPNLKPNTQSISLRLPVNLLESIKIEANRRDIPYQALIKVWLVEKMEETVVRRR
jgi:predicted DNA binding CopG/RHH family protein